MRKDETFSLGNEGNYVAIAERFALTGEKFAQTGEICLAIDENGAGMLMNCERIGVKAHLDLNFWLTGENYAATRVNCG